MSLTDRIRPNVEAAPWVIAEINKREEVTAALIADLTRVKAENAVLCDLKQRLIALRNKLGRIDLTDSSVRDEVYSLVRTAEGIGPT